MKSCIKSIIDAIQMIYQDTKYLERIQLPSHVEAIYQPLEDPDSSTYFQKDSACLSSQDIKASDQLLFVHIFKQILRSIIFFTDFLQYVPLLSITAASPVMPNYTL